MYNFNLMSKCFLFQKLHQLCSSSNLTTKRIHEISLLSKFEADDVLFMKKMSKRQTLAGNQECMNVWMFWTTFVFMSMLKTYSHTFSLSLSHSHSFSLSHSFNLSFNHSRHAEQLLFWCLGSNVTLYRWKCQSFFLTAAASSPSPVTLDVIELVPS